MSKLRLACLWLVTLAAGVLVYLPGLPGGFIYDDRGSIVNNPYLRFDHLTLQDLILATFSSPTSGLGRPLSMLSFALDAHFFGITPLPFKLTNILIHVSCGIVLWFVARELLRAYSGVARRPISDENIVWISFAATVMWLVHPLNLTTVLYVVQRETSLSALFTAAAILTYLIGRRRERDGNPARALIWLWTPTLTALGLLCKETAALLPVFLLITEITLLRFRGQDNGTSRNAICFLTLFLAVPLLLAAIWMATLPGGPGSLYAARDFTLGERLLTECRVLCDYLRWIFIPDITHLAFYHDDILPSRGLLDPPTTLACILFIVALISAALFLRKRQPLISFAILWFFAGQALESTVLPLILAFEHRNYLPDFGLLTGLSAAFYLWGQEHGRLRVIKIAIVAGIAIFACITALRSWEWHSEFSFAQYEVAHQPRSPLALEELAWSYTIYMQATKDTSVLPAAIHAEEQARMVDINTVVPDLSIAYIYAVAHDIPKAKSYLEATAIDAKTAAPTATFMYALETLYQWNTSQDPSLDTAIDDIFQSAIQNQGVAHLPCYLANIFNTYAVLKESNGKILDAASLMHKATALCPNNMTMRINFAYLLLRYNDPIDAKPQIEALSESRNPLYFPERKALEEILRDELAAQQKKIAISSKNESN